MTVRQGEHCSLDLESQVKSGQSEKGSRACWTECSSVSGRCPHCDPRSIILETWLGGQPAQDVGGCRACFPRWRGRWVRGLAASSRRCFCGSGARPPALSSILHLQNHSGSLPGGPHHGKGCRLGIPREGRLKSDVLSGTAGTSFIHLE